MILVVKIESRSRRREENLLDFEKISKEVEKGEVDRTLRRSRWCNTKTTPDFFRSYCSTFRQVRWKG